MPAKKLSHKQAYEMARQAGIKFTSDDPHAELSTSDTVFMRGLAEKCGYRKSKNSSSSLSTGALFYQLLYREHKNGKF